MPKGERRCPGCNHFTQCTTSDLCKICSDGVRIPIDDVRPIIQKLISERHYYQENGKWMGGYSILVDEVDRPDDRVHAKTISALISPTNPARYVYYNVVDKILTRTNNFQLWYREPLARWYHEPRERVRPRQHSKTPCTCGNVMARESKKCSECYAKDRAEKREKNRCRCGKPLSWGSTRCRSCYFEDRRSLRGADWPRKNKQVYSGQCLDCKKPTLRSKKRCRSCYYELFAKVT